MAMATMVIAARINRAELVKALRHPVSVATKHVLDSHRAVLLESLGNGTMTVTGSDGRLTVRVSCPVEEATQWSATVPAKDMNLLTGFCGGEEVSITPAGPDNLRIVSGDDEFTIARWNEANGPKADARPFDPFFTIGRADLQELASALAPVVARDEAKPWLECIHISTTEGFAATATDGVRVASWRKAIAAESSTKTSALVRPRIISLAAMLAAPGEEIRVSKNDSAIALTGHGFEVRGEIENAQYPDVMRLVPKEYPITATVDRAAFLGSCRMATVAGKEPALRVTLGDGRVITEAVTGEMSKFRRTMAATVQGELSGTAGVNAKLLLKPLESLKGSEIRIGFSSPRAPIMFTSDSTPNLKHVILPLITF